MSKIYYESLSNKIVDVAFYVHKKIGPGLSEFLYQKGFIAILQRSGIAVLANQSYHISIDDIHLGEYRVDMIVENKVVIENKAKRSFHENDKSQLLNYLHVTGIKVGYLFNFANTRLEFKRFVL